MIMNLMLALAVYSVVPNVDLNRYQGRWHEIARLPNRFQAKCVSDVTADYMLRKDGNIGVINRCRTSEGKTIEARGVAKRVGKGHPDSVLKVRFAPGFLSLLPQVWGDYQILALAPDYSYAAVGSPDLKYLWILSRSPQLSHDTLEKLVEEMRVCGFDVDRLQKTSH